MSCKSELRRAAILAAALAVGLSGCGFRPLHGQGGAGAEASLAMIQITRIADRNGQKLHNLLLDRLNPKGPPGRPAYILSVRLNEGLQNLAIRKDESATRANLTLTAHFTLARTGSDDTYSGAAVSINSYNILQSDFATLSAENDARGRALRTLADEIRGRIAAALINPKFFDKKRRKN